ncbi:MAG: hypothetical protein SAK29_41690 [Scytonema sp. PMC 1069.18]|nr:hypothetical protein [Scytonema sp. PMC 1069.18]MEC4882438.1 hypothetical protein [Scytonema sp. PMC 1070.18]
MTIYCGTGVLARERAPHNGEFISWKSLNEISVFSRIETGFRAGLRHLKYR